MCVGVNKAMLMSVVNKEEVIDIPNVLLLHFQLREHFCFISHGISLLSCDVILPHKLLSVTLGALISRVSFLLLLLLLITKITVYMDINMSKKLMT